MRRALDEQRNSLLRAISAARPGNRGRVMMQKVSKNKGRIGDLQFKVYELENAIEKRITGK